MIGLFIDGKHVGILTIGENVVRDCAAGNKVVEMRNTSGATVGHFSPAAEPAGPRIDTPVNREPATPAEPIIPWDPSITREELDRRMREEPSYTYEEVKAKLGWK